jgi:hypothetical protein
MHIYEKQKKITVSLIHAQNAILYIITIVKESMLRDIRNFEIKLQSSSC